jgi:D-alanyl-D-alanine carboxypeptidase
VLTEVLIKLSKMLNTLLRKFTTPDFSLKEPFTAPDFVKQLKVHPISSRSTKIKNPEKSNQSLPKLTRKVTTPRKPERIPEHSLSISAKSWIILDLESMSFLSGSCQSTQREIASLTKIMTCLVVLEEARLKPGSLEDSVQVSSKASSTEGTSAGLFSKDCLKVVDLLFALMLPSGNDAAVALAEYFGAKMAGNCSFIERFVKKMNETARNLNLFKTFFENPHGMSTSLNVSTAEDVARMTGFALKLTVFRRIVACKEYFCTVRGERGPRKVLWVNTNRLLKKGFYGVKTGFTPAAGPCLCCAFKGIVIVVLGCKYKHDRWKDAVTLCHWALGS